MASSGTEGRRLAFIIDLDDTLIESQGVYARASSGFVQLMEAEGFDAQEAGATFQALDLEAVRTLGLVDDRYGTSMTETYRALCAARGRAVDEALLARIWEIACPVWLGHFPLVPGAAEVLAALQAEGHLLILYTRGSERLQGRKVREAGLEPYFATRYIVPHKGEAELEQILRRHALAPEHTWVIGDGVRSEINPALALHLNPILVEGQTWAYEAEPLLDPGVPRIPSFARLLSVVPGWKRS